MSKQILYDLAMSFLHVPYEWGGASPSGIDCSGLVVELLTAVGVVPPGYDDTAQGLLHKFIATPHPEFGDLAFYGSSESRITHVALCLSPTLMIEAGGGDKGTTRHNAAAHDARVRIRPIRARKDLVGIRRPGYGF